LVGGQQIPVSASRDLSVRQQGFFNVREHASILLFVASGGLGTVVVMVTLATTSPLRGVVSAVARSRNL